MVYMNNISTLGEDFLHTNDLYVPITDDLMRSNFDHVSQGI